MTSAIHARRVSNLSPTKKRKILKKLFNMVSPSIKYAKSVYLCLTN